MPLREPSAVTSDPIAVSDASLLLSPDRDSFGEFYDRYVPLIMRYFLLRSACPQTAADLTAETFAQALVSRRRYRDPGDGTAKGWIVTIANRQFLKFVRKRRAETKALQRLSLRAPTLDSESFDRIDELVDFAKLRPLIASSLAELPNSWAAAVSLRILQQQSYPCVAAAMGCSEAAARVRVSRGLGRLAALMEGNI